MKKLLFLLSLSVVLSACSKQTPNYAEYWKSWGDQQLNKWLIASETFSEQANLFCTQGGSLEALQTEYKTLAISWTKMNGFPYKAITDFNLGFELYAWPDKRNMIPARLTTRVNQGSISTEALQKATATEKGLLALEWLTFEPDLDKIKRCNALPAISIQYASNTRKISDYHFDNPLIQPTWIEYKTSVEGQSIALNLLFQQIAQISNRLKTSINNESELIPILSEGWRAGITTEIYETSLSVAIKHLMALAERSDITVNSQGLLKDQIITLQNLLNDMQQDVFRWQDLQQAIIDNEHLIEGPIAQDLDVLIGFNNFDGD